MSETCAVCDTQWDPEERDECPDCGSTHVWDMGAAFAEAGFFHWDDAVRSDEAIESYHQAVRQWGEEAQLNKAAEEASELSAAINRLLNPESDRDDIVEELIDVRLILEVLRTRYATEDLTHRMEEQVADFRRRVREDEADGFRVGEDGGKT